MKWLNLAYRIVGFFKVRKFREFHGCCSFVKFNPSKKQTTHCIAEFLADPFVKIKSRKTENQPFAEFKYLEKTNYTVCI